MWSWRRVVATKVSGPLSDCSLKNCVFSQKKHGAMAGCLGKTPEISEVILGTVAIGSSPCSTWVGEIDARDLNSCRALNPSRTSTDLVNIENTNIFFAVLVPKPVSKLDVVIPPTLHEPAGRFPSAMGKGTGGQRHDSGDPFPFFLVVYFPEGPDSVAGSTRPATKSERVTKWHVLVCFCMFFGLQKWAKQIQASSQGVLSLRCEVDWWISRLTSVSSALSYSHWK